MIAQSHDRTGDGGAEEGLEAVELARLLLDERLRQLVVGAEHDRVVRHGAQRRQLRAAQERRIAARLVSAIYRFINR